MQTVDFLLKHHACREGAKWALSISDEMSDVWDALVANGKHEWLLWTVTRRGVFPDSVLRKLSCRFVRETPLHDGRMVLDLLTDERSRKAIEVAEAYADGNVTTDELSYAYAACADAAADAAADADRAVADAAYSDACAARSAARAAWAACASARIASDAAAKAAAEAAAWASWPAYDASRASARIASDAAAEAAAKLAHVKMIAELGNPFKK